MRVIFEQFIYLFIFIYFYLFTFSIHFVSGQHTESILIVFQMNEISLEAPDLSLFILIKSRELFDVLEVIISPPKLQ